MKQGTSMNINEQKQCIFRAQDYISKHLEDDLCLEMLATNSAVSPFHFHRIFKSVCGETLYNFIQRKRLEKSCTLLISDKEAKIIAIAIACGFSNASSFAKAFRKQYNISPSEYRNSGGNLGVKQSKSGTYKSNLNKEKSSFNEYISNTDLEKLLTRRMKMEAKIEELPAYRIAYMRQIGPYGDGNVQLMQQLKKWAITRDLLDASTVIIGIAHDDPSVTPPDKCRYDACIVIPSDYELESGICETMLQGGKYALFRVEHTPKAISDAWINIFSQWLPESGYQIDLRSIFERYTGVSDEECKLEPVLCEICIPIKKK